MLVKRLIVLGAGFAVLLSACASSGTTATSSTVNIQATSYHTLPPTQSTAPPNSSATDGSGPPAGSVTTDAIQYTIQRGDSPGRVAKRFGITLSALTQANLNTPGYTGFLVGVKIIIPAGATIPTSTLPGQTTTTTAAPCVMGTYVLVKGDNPQKVARHLKVTFDQLNAANAHTKGYTAFLVGTTINVPGKNGCTG
jgi:LysM repeat protein